MLRIGRRQILIAQQHTILGWLLENDDHDQALLPNRLTPSDIHEGMALEVFIFTDPQGHLSATTQFPQAQVGEIAWLPVKEINDTGAFLEWGHSKDLLLPYNEQPREVRRLLETGRHVMVAVFVDDQKRITASAHLNDFISPDVAPDEPSFRPGQPVDVMVEGKTDMGYRVIVDNRYWGLVYNDEVFQPIPKGTQQQGYILKQRDDGRLDVTLRPQGNQKRDNASEIILEKLKKEGGYMAVSDKSSPELIYRIFGLSKKVFKQAIGGLYRDRAIAIESAGIRLIQP